MTKTLESQSTLEVICFINGIERMRWQKEVQLRWQAPMKPGSWQLSHQAWTMDTLKQMEGITVTDNITFEVHDLSKEQEFLIGPFNIETLLEGITIKKISMPDIAYLAMTQFQNKLNELSNVVFL